MLAGFEFSVRFGCSIVRFAGDLREICHIASECPCSTTGSEFHTEYRTGYGDAMRMCCYAAYHNPSMATANRSMPEMIHCPANLNSGCQVWSVQEI